MSEKYKVVDSSVSTFVTFTIIDWVDLFTRTAYTKILDDSLNYCIKHKGLRVHAYVYMTNHIHLIVSSQQESLQNIVRDFKKHTSKELLKAIKEYPESRREWLLAKFSYAANKTNRASNYKIWKDGFHPVILDTYEKIEQRLKYIHDNPVKEGYVYEPSFWVNSSYVMYEDDTKLKCDVEITPLT